MSQNRGRPLRLVGDAAVNAASSDRAELTSEAEPAEMAAIMRIPMSSDEGLPDDAA